MYPLVDLFGAGKGEGKAAAEGIAVVAMLLTRAVIEGLGYGCRRETVLI
jgi:hypothetical protein